MPARIIKSGTTMDFPGRFIVLLVTAAVFAPGQSVYPIGNVFKPEATPAESIYNVSLLMLAICAAIFLVVGGLLLFTIVRFRRHKMDNSREPAQIYGSNRIEIAWTVIPVLIVIVLSMATARAVVEVQNKRMPPDALKATVVGHQWWWEIRYPELGIVTADELHVPQSTLAKPAHTFLKLQSADVAHSFWVPQLSGKVDLIPGITNSMWLDPRRTGIYLGNCAEYCGTQHANMLIRVIVDSPADFEKWAASQKVNASSDPHLEAARAAFLSLNCINCHTVSGTAAAGTFGPDLSHVMSRTTLGAGVLPNTAENLRAWVRDPQAIKRGNLMPNMQLNSRELDQVVTYLASLK
jgi:cytochrome c oxidase subunit 2